MGLGKVIGWGVALVLVGGYFLFAVGVTLYGIAVSHTAPPAWLAIRGAIGFLILLGITAAIYTRFSKALREYRTSRASRVGKPLQ
jgi:cell division protein FtsX